MGRYIHLNYGGIKKPKGMGTGPLVALACLVTILVIWTLAPIPITAKFIASIGISFIFLFLDRIIRLW